MYKTFAKSLFLCTCAFGAVFNVQAIEPKDMLKAIVEDGKSVMEGKVTGPVADMMRAQTRSKATPYIRMEKLPSDIKDCTMIKDTTTMPDIPSTKGENLGDYVVVSKLTLCAPGKLPKNMKAQEIVSCKIGKKDCQEFMPKSK